MKEVCLAEEQAGAKTLRWEPDFLILSRTREPTIRTSVLKKQRQWNQTNNGMEQFKQPWKFSKD